MRLWESGSAWSPVEVTNLDIGRESKQKSDGGPAFAIGPDDPLSDAGDTHMHRREFLQNAAALAVGGAIWRQGGQAGENTAATKPRRATLAQVAVHKNVEQNLA